MSRPEDRANNRYLPQEICLKFVFSTVVANGIAVVASRTSPGIVMTKCKSHMVLEGLMKRLPEAYSKRRITGPDKRISKDVTWRGRFTNSLHCLPCRHVVDYFFSNKTQKLRLLSPSECFSNADAVYSTPKKFHDDVIKWKHFPRYWSFVRGIQRPPVNSPHKGQWRGAFVILPASK